MHTLPTEDLQIVFNQLSDIWPKNKKFLVTGGTGFFGRWLVESISVLEKKLDSNNKFYIISRANNEENFKKIPVLHQACFEIISQDLAKPFKIETAFDYVIHAATDVQKIKSGEINDSTSFVQATKNLISALSATKNLCFLYVSSGGVYKSSQFGTDEKAAVNATTSYAESKLHSEKLIAENFSNHKIARCFSFLGPYVGQDMAAMNMLNCKLKKQMLVVKSPAVVRSYMYPTDLVIQLFKLLILPTPQTIYNIGSEQQVTLKDLAQKIESLGAPVGIQLENRDNSGLAGNVYFPSTQRIQSDLKLMPILDLDTAISKTFNFLKKESANERF